MRWLDSITDQMDMNLSKFLEIVEDMEAWCAAVHEVAQLDTAQRLSSNKLQSKICRQIVLSRSVVSDSLQPCGSQPTRLRRPWNFPGKNTGVGCHFLFQGIFLTQGLNLHLLCLLYWQADSLPLAPPRKPYIYKNLRITKKKKKCVFTFNSFELLPGLKSSMRVSSRAETPSVKLRGTFVHIQGCEESILCCFYDCGCPTVVCGPESYQSACPTLAVGEMTFGKCPFRIHNSPMVSPHTLGLKSSLDCGSQGPTVFGWQPPPCSLCHPPLDGFPPGTVASGPSACQAHYPLWLSSPLGRSSPSINLSQLLTLQYLLNFSSSLCLGLTALSLQPPRAFFSSSRHLPLTLFYLLDDLVCCLFLHLNVNSVRAGDFFFFFFIC